MLLDKHHIHFVGVGGVGMVALAKVLLEAGHKISGSDLKPSAAALALASQGATISEGHSAEAVDGAELVVASSAIPANNPELERAREKGIPAIKRAELLGMLTRQRQSICVAGTHGKTTTSAMLAWVLERAGLGPTFMVGGELLNLGTGARLGAGEYLVAEADEFDGSFLRFSPWTAVVTNIEADHLDYYGTLDAIVDAFRSFIRLVPANGYAVVSADDTRAREIAQDCRGRVVTYGVATDAGWQAVNIHPNRKGGNDFDAVGWGVLNGPYSLRVPGRHNVLNALATIAVAAVAFGDRLDRRIVRTALAEFQGTARRFEHKGTVGGVAVYDDYAHHPTEIRATLSAARERHKGRLWVVFQPHTYHRTRELFSQFVAAFDLADRVVITDVYMPPGREADTLGISSRDLVKAMAHQGAEYVGDLDEAARHLYGQLAPGDMLLVMGAGSITRLAGAVLELLKRRG